MSNWTMWGTIKTSVSWIFLKQQNSLTSYLLSGDEPPQIGNDCCYSLHWWGMGPSWGRESWQSRCLHHPIWVLMIQYLLPSKTKTRVAKPLVSTCMELIASFPPINDHSVSSLIWGTSKTVAYEAGTQLCASSCNATHSHLDGTSRFLNAAGREMAFSGGHLLAGNVVVISKRLWRVPWKWHTSGFEGCV